jgi:hypothetical protein
MRCVDLFLSPFTSVDRLYGVSAHADDVIEMMGIVMHSSTTSSK